MTGNEIIKALECCTSIAACSECPYDELKAPDCNETMLKDVLDLIQRQQGCMQLLELYKANDERIKAMVGMDMAEAAVRFASYMEMKAAGGLLNTHQAAVILAETFGYECPCNFNGIDEWFPEVCDLADLCPDGKMSAIACWEQYIKIKLAELKGGE